MHQPYTCPIHSMLVLTNNAFISIQDLNNGQGHPGPSGAEVGTPPLLVSLIAYQDTFQSFGDSTTQSAPKDIGDPRGEASTQAPPTLGFPWPPP